MRIAVPVKNKELQLFKNAGHAPYFAIFDVIPDGANKLRVRLEDMRDNPKANIHHEEACSHDHGSHDHSQHEHSHGADTAVSEEKKTRNELMAEKVKDCNVLLADFACNGTRGAFLSAGVQLEFFSGFKTAQEVITAYLKGKPEPSES